MLLKVPNSSGNGYYGHETILYVSDSASSSSSEDFDLDSPTDSDFTDYLWMEHEEEFEKEVMQQLEEEELTEQCLEAMREDEQELRNLHNAQASLEAALEALRMHDPQLVQQSKLNPNAAEFIPAAKQ